MFTNILNIIILIGFIISVLYGVIVIIKNNKIEAIFKVTLISMTALLVSRLFFLALGMSDGDVNDFSVGVLGQVSAYLFLALANKTYLPFKSIKRKINMKACLILIVPVLCYYYSFTIIKSVGDIVCSILYLCSTCLAMYFSYENLLLSKIDNN